MTMTETADIPDPAEGDGQEFADFNCFVVTSPDAKFRPRLYVVDADEGGVTPDPRGEMFGSLVEAVWAGVVSVPSPSLTIEIEAAAMAKFGTVAARMGRPVAAEYADVNPFDVVAGKVAVALATWPALAPAYLRGSEPTADAVAAALQLSLADVYDVIFKLGRLKRDAQVTAQFNRS